MSIKLKISVHYDINNGGDSYAQRWIEQLEKKEVSVSIINCYDSNIIDSVRNSDGLMWHWFHKPGDKQAAPKILQAIQFGLGIPVFPSYKTSWHYDEKVAQHYLLEAIDAPKINSWVFWKYEEALNFLRSCSFPVIFKLSVGAGSSNVIKLNSQDDAIPVLKKIFRQGIFPYTINEYKPKAFPKDIHGFKKLIKRGLDAISYFLFQRYPSPPGYYLLQKNYAYFQEFLPNNSHDIRITVIGNRAFGFIRYNRPNDFRASGSGLIDYDPNKIPLDAVRIAHKISKDNEFQSMAYDFLYSANRELLVNEISYCYADWAVHNCPGYWDRNLQWHQGNVWPEQAHVEDFIYYIQNGEVP